MLAFVTSVRHPDNCHSYGRVEGLLRETLGSWDRQDSSAWFGVVVGNLAPSFEMPSRVEFLSVDFDPPSELRSPMTGIPAVLRDKGTKLAVGLEASRRLGATHVMFVDADDLVSRRLAGHVAQHTGSRGWVITRGWRYNAERRAVRPHDGDFHLQCGSSHIVRTDEYPSPQLSERPTQDELYAVYGEKLERWIGSHMYIHDDLELDPLPFPGALYRVGSGEAHSGNSLGGLAAPVSAAMAWEFGVPATGVTPWRIARAVLPSGRALIERLPPAVRRAAQPQ